MRLVKDKHIMSQSKNVEGPLSIAAGQKPITSEGKSAGASPKLHNVKESYLMLNTVDQSSLK